MTRMIVDATMQARLKNLDGVLEVCDETGRTLGYFHPALDPGSLEGARQVRSPFSDEELEQLRKQRTGSPLAEILERLSRS